MATFATESAKRAQLPYWWISIEGLQYRYSNLRAGVDAGWNPADSGTNQHIKGYLVEPPTIGGQESDPINGSCDVPSHSFRLVDNAEDITYLVAVSDSSQTMGRLTKDPGVSGTTLYIEDSTEFDSSGVIYLDRETIYYSGKASVTNKGTCTANYADTGCIAAAGTCEQYLFGTADAQLTQSTENYWKGAKVVITAGGNNGQTRTILSSWYDNSDSKEYFLFDSPFDNAFDDDGTDEFSITTPPNLVRSTDLTEAANYWDGAVITFLTGDNAGLTAYVYSFSAIRDICTLVGYLPFPVESGDTFTITTHSLTGCTRAFWGSDAMAHVMTDENSVVIIRTIYTKPPFLKTRKVKFYESRYGLTEENARLVAIGFIDDYNLSEDGNCYDFSCSGLSKILTKEILSKQAKGRILKYPMWGGEFELRGEVVDWVDTSTYAETVKGCTIQWSGLVRLLLNGEHVDAMSVNRFFLQENSSLPTTGANVKIDDEILHYTVVGRSNPWQRDSEGYIIDHERFLTAFLGKTTEFASGDIWGGYDVGASGFDNTISCDYVVSAACFDMRGLFSEKIGFISSKTKKAQVGFKGYGGSDQFELASSTDRLDVVGFIDSKGKTFTGDLFSDDGCIDYPPIMIRGFIQPHQPDAEVTQVLVCDNTELSDFPILCRLDYSGRAGGSFTVGDHVYGAAGASTDKCYIVHDDADGTSGVLWVACWTKTSGFTHNGVITSGVVTANTASDNTSDLGERPRNNAIDVVLQLLCSMPDRTNYPLGTNGKYDTLPNGMGMGVDEDLIDTSGIEAVRDKYFGHMGIDFIIYEKTKAKDWLEENIFRPLQVFPYITNNGLLGLAYLYTRAEAVKDDDGNFVTFDDDHLDAKQLPNWTSGQEPLTKLTLLYNRHPANDSYLAKANIIFENSADWYQDLGRTVEIKCDALYCPDKVMQEVSNKNMTLPTLVRRFINVYWDRQALFPCPIIECRTPYSDMLSDIGDIVKITEPNLPNMRTSARGLTTEYFQIIGCSREYSNGNYPQCMRWKLAQIGVHDMNFICRAPSAQVSAHANVGGVSRLTLFTQVFSRGQDATGALIKDISYFSVGQKVILLDANYCPAAGGPEVAEITALDTTNKYMTLDILLATAPSSGWIVEFAPYDSATSTQQDTRGFLADESHTLGSSGESAFKYM